MMTVSSDHQLSLEVAEKVGKRYKRIMSRPWFRYFRHLREEMLTTYLRKHPEASLATVLDLGCADGVHLKLFPPESLKVGIDLSLQVLLTADAASDASLIAGDACSLPVKNNSTHFILACGLVHHVHRHLREFFDEVYRVLVPGGLLYIDEPNGCNPLWYLVLQSPLGREVDGGITKLITVQEIINAGSLFQCEDQIFYGLFKKPVLAVRSVVVLRKPISRVSG